MYCSPLVCRHRPPPPPTFTSANGIILPRHITESSCQDMLHTLVSGKKVHPYSSAKGRVEQAGALSWPARRSIARAPTTDYHREHTHRETLEGGKLPDSTARAGRQRYDTTGSATYRGGAPVTEISTNHLAQHSKKCVHVQNTKWHSKKHLPWGTRVCYSTSRNPPWSGALAFSHTKNTSIL